LLGSIGKWSGIWPTCFCHQGFMEKMKGRRLGLHKVKDFVTEVGNAEFLDS